MVALLELELVILTLYLLAVISTLGAAVYYISIATFYTAISGYISSTVISSLQIIASLLILISTCTNSFNLAYTGNMIYNIFIFLGLLNTLIFISITQVSYWFVSTWIIYFAVYVLMYTLTIYYAYIVWSFTKELGLGNMAKIYGFAEMTTGYQPYQQFTVNVNVVQGQGQGNQGYTMTTSTPAYNQSQNGNQAAYQP